MNATEPARNVLGQGVQVKGSLQFGGDLFFDGVLEGEVATTGELTVGPHGDVRADVKARAVVVYGRVTGNIVASDRCDLRANSQLHGDLQTARLTIEDGATFVGRSEVSPAGVRAGAKGGG